MSSNTSMKTMSCQFQLQVFENKGPSFEVLLVVCCEAAVL